MALIDPAASPKEPQSPAGRHALYAQGMHILVIVIVVVAVCLLTWSNHMQGDVAAGILGAALGHAGSAAMRSSGVRQGANRSDPEG